MSYPPQYLGGPNSNYGEPAQRPPGEHARKMPPQPRWWIAPIIAVPLGVVLLIFTVALVWVWFIVFPLVIIMLSLGVGVCLVLSRQLPNAHVVGVGLMLAVAVAIGVFSAILLLTGRA
jgi:hypothetical protein